MPAFITHYLYGVDLFHTSNSKLMKQTVKKHLGAYCLGLQGPDIFYYYIPSVIGKKTKNLGHMMHETKVSAFFENYMYYMSKLSGEHFSIALSYFYGFLAHYTLDYVTHPYIYSRAYYLPSSTFSRNYYCGMHGEIETCIDFLLLKRKKQWRPSDFRQQNTIQLTPSEVSVISEILSCSINKTYYKTQDVRVKPSTVKKTIFFTKIAPAMLHSRFGIRKKILHSFEQTLFHHNIIATTINYNRMKDLYDAMNSSHRIWQNPWNLQMVSTESFDDLYEKAKYNYERLSYLLQNTITSHSILNINTIKPLIKEFGNASYHSGLNCDLEDYQPPH